MSRRYTIGRDRNCDVNLTGGSVSRLHAEIWRAENGELMVADRGSSNGTSLLRNGASFDLGEKAVQPGDLLRMGIVILPVEDLIKMVESRFPAGLS